MSPNVFYATETGADTPATQIEKENIAGDGCPTSDEPHIDNLNVGAGESAACGWVSFELEDLFDLVDDLCDIHAEMTHVLGRFANLMGICAAATPTSHEISALHGLAIANAEIASEVLDAFERVDELRQVLLESQLDELLRALEGPEADMCECASADRTEQQ